MSVTADRVHSSRFMETVTQNKHRAWGIEHRAWGFYAMHHALCTMRFCLWLMPFAPSPQRGEGRVRGLFILISITLLLQGVGYAGEKKGGVNITRGKGVYHERCAVCHGIDGNAVLPLSPSFAKGERLDKTDEELLQTIRHGKNMMPAWKEILTDDELKEVLMYARVVAGDKVFEDKCLRCHSGSFPRLRGNLPATKGLKDFTGMLDVCRSCEVEREMTREELIEVIKYLRTLGK
ncbi:MAG: cytochrome c [Deltaproteobacteria bacterium]|nr:cytochrome c [Deltaproteobacteria bacterium]